MPISPEVLLKSIASGDERSLQTLYEDFGSALFGVVVRMCGDRLIAEEVLQDTFLKIWRHASSYDSARGRPFTWMVNIARNTAIDCLRSAGHKHAAAIRSMDDHVYDVDMRVAETVDTGEIHASLGSLKEEHRSLIDMAYYRGYSQQEIATNTGIPLGTVKSRTRSALMELRTLLKDHQ